MGRHIEYTAHSKNDVEQTKHFGKVYQCSMNQNSEGSRLKFGSVDMPRTDALISNNTKSQQVRLLSKFSLKGQKQI